MQIHLIDGTYELFRHYFAVPSRQDANGKEVAALVGVVRSVLGILREGATHIAVATDHTVESFRNGMYDGYKSGEGLEPELWEQFHPLEDALRALGVVVWPMSEFEADDGLASAATQLAAHQEVERIYICSPDKDLSQCVVADRIVQVDRRKGETRTEEGVWEKFGVGPRSITDYLALVGDTADGFPGLPRWGAKGTAAVLSRYPRLEDIPEDPADWDDPPRGAAGLSKTLREQWNDALLFRELATLRLDAVTVQSPEELRWTGPTPEFDGVCAELGVPRLSDQAAAIAGTRASR